MPSARRLPPALLGLVRLLAAASVSLATGSATAGAPPATEGWPEVATPEGVVAEGASDAALIVAIEDYGELPDIPGAVANGSNWFRFLSETEHLPVDHIHFLQNRLATRETILASAKEAAAAVHGGKLWVIFIGHGAPAREGNQGVLVGADALQSAASLYARSISQGDLDDALHTDGGKTVMILDACFSGRSGTGAPLANGLQPVLLTTHLPSAQRTLLAAGAADQFAGPLVGSARPAFSYLVLGALGGWGDANGDGLVTATEATSYARRALATLQTGRSQTPMVVGEDLPLARGGRANGPTFAWMATVRDAPPKPKEEADGARPGSGARTAGLVVGAVGLVGLGVGGALGFQAKAKNDDSASHCGINGVANDCDAAGVALRKDAKSFGTFSTVSFALGGAALLGGTLLYVTAPSQKMTVGVGPTGVQVGGVW